MSYLGSVTNQGGGVTLTAQSPTSVLCTKSAGTASIRLTCDTSDTRPTKIHYVQEVFPSSVKYEYDINISQTNTSGSNQSSSIVINFISLSGYNNSASPSTQYVERVNFFKYNQSGTIEAEPFQGTIRTLGNPIKTAVNPSIVSSSVTYSNANSTGSIIGKTCKITQTVTIKSGNDYKGNPINSVLVLGTRIGSSGDFDVPTSVSITGSTSNQTKTLSQTVTSGYVGKTINHKCNLLSTNWSTVYASTATKSSTVNTPPTLSSISVSPEEIATGEGVTFTASYADVNSQTHSLQVSPTSSTANDFTQVSTASGASTSGSLTYSLQNITPPHVYYFKIKDGLDFSDVKSAIVQKSTGYIQQEQSDESFVQGKVWRLVGDEWKPASEIWKLTITENWQKVDSEKKDL